MPKKKSKKKKIIIIIAIILIFILWVSSCTSKMKKAMEELNANSTQIDEITRRDLIESVGATGDVTSINRRDITVDLTSAQVKKINVKVGDIVKKGTILASFNVSDTYQDLKEAEDDLNSTIEVNNITLEDAKRNLDSLEKKYDSTIKELKNQIDDAKKAYNDAKSLYNINPTEENKILKDKASDAVDKAKDNYYDTKEELEEKIKTTENEIKKLELTQSTSKAESQIRTYKTQVKNGTIKAPIDGTITQINYEVGDTYTPGSVFMSIDDCSSYEISAEVGEYDISKVKVGQPVVIKTDATGETEINGTVKEVAPIATKSTDKLTKSNKTYTVKVSVDENNDQLKLDMSSSISIIIDEHKNVLTVPYNAIYTDQDGKYYIIKADGEERSNIYVNIDMESSYYTEISGNDIYEGMKILIEKKDEENPLLKLMTDGGF